MMNSTLEMSVEAATGWLHVPLQIRHPWNLPEVVRQDHVVAFEQVGPLETLTHGGVKAGIFLTVAQLKLIQGQFKFPMPTVGSGKNQRIIKKDYAEALVEHLFPEESKQRKHEMVCGIMGKNWKHLGPKKASKHSADIVSAFNGLPQEDMGEYSKLTAVAKDELLLKEQRDQRARVETVQKRTKEHETPLVLRDLHPSMAGCRITRHPVLKRFQAFYTTYDEKGR